MKDESAPGATTSPPVRSPAFEIGLDVHRTRARTARLLGVALIAFTLLVGAAIPDLDKVAGTDGASLPTLWVRRRSGEITRNGD